MGAFALLSHLLPFFGTPDEIDIMNKRPTLATKKVSGEQEWTKNKQEIPIAVYEWQSGDIGVNA